MLFLQAFICSKLVLRDFVAEEKQASPSSFPKQVLLRMLVSVFGFIKKKPVI